MSEAMSTHGMFSWNELITTDPEAAKEFYTQLLGWTAEEWPIGDTKYLIVKAGGKEIGGIMPVPEQAKGMKPTWGVYVTVDDVDATAAKAQKLGGTICVPPKDIPSVGRFTVIQDPQGAMIAAITYVQKSAA